MRICDKIVTDYGLNAFLIAPNIAPMIAPPKALPIRALTSSLLPLIPIPLDSYKVFCVTYLEKLQSTLKQKTQLPAYPLFDDQE